MKEETLHKNPKTPRCPVGFTEMELPVKAESIFLNNRTLLFALFEQSCATGRSCVVVRILAEIKTNLSRFKLKS